MMKDLFPSNPEADKQALKQMAQAGAQEVAPTKDYIKESVSVPQGSMPLDLGMSDFAKLAGLKEQKDGDYARGSDATPKMSKPSSTGEQPHPLKDKLVGDSIAYEEQELDELGVRGAGPVSFAAIQTQLQDLMNNLKTLEAEYRKQMQQAQQPQQRQNAFAGGSFALDDPDYAQKIAGESIDSIKDTLYAALNKKMGE